MTAIRSSQLPESSLIVMGVAGAGKTTVGEALATDLGIPFVDADDFHPAANVDKMRRGVPLEDRDRKGWLDALATRLEEGERGGAPIVLACSALRESHRWRLGVDGFRRRLIYLRLSRETARGRLRSRTGHFLPEALLESQFETLEEPEEALTLDASLPVDELVAAVRRELDLDRRERNGPRLVGP